MAISKRANGSYQTRIKGADGRVMAQTFPTKKRSWPFLTKTFPKFPQSGPQHLAKSSRQFVTTDK